MIVTVNTGSRLHLGFTNLSEDLGRSFGGLGVALERPTAIVTVTDGAAGDIVASSPEQVRTLFARFCEHYRVKPEVRIEVRESIPAHVGLGSGTQLALAAGMALATVCGIDATVPEIAAVMGRGRRSGIGVAAFQAGGFIIDGGHCATTGPAEPSVPTVAWRRDFPEDWCFVIAVPEASAGLYGRSEEGVFEALSPSVRISQEVCRIVLLQLMPALVEHDIEGVGRALTAIDRKTGAYFVDAQRGVYNDAAVAETVSLMLREGAWGAGQSSWGPAVYGLCYVRDAERLAESVRVALAAAGVTGTVFVAHGRNTEARVDVRGSDG